MNKNNSISNGPVYGYETIEDMANEIVKPKGKLIGKDFKLYDRPTSFLDYVSNFFKGLFSSYFKIDTVLIAMIEQSERSVQAITKEYQSHLKEKIILETLLQNLDVIKQEISSALTKALPGVLNVNVHKITLQDLKEFEGFKPAKIEEEIDNEVKKGLLDYLDATQVQFKTVKFKVIPREENDNPDEIKLTVFIDKIYDEVAIPKTQRIKDLIERLKCVNSGFESEEQIVSVLSRRIKDIEGLSGVYYKTLLAWSHLLNALDQRFRHAHPRTNKNEFNQTPDAQFAVSGMQGKFKKSFEDVVNPSNKYLDDILFGSSSGKVKPII